MKAPSLPIPEPLRAADQPSFTHYSVVTRLPEIARRTLAENPFPPETVRQIQALIDEIPHGKIRQVRLPAMNTGGSSHDSASERLEIAGWSDWIAPYLGQDWLQVPWFFAEEYFYLRILEASGYFAPGAWHRRDPYADQKRLGLESERQKLRALALNVQSALALTGSDWQEALAGLLLIDLWGNQNDLSMWPVLHPKADKVAAGTAIHPSGGDGSGRAAGETAVEERVLANDLEQVLNYLARFEPAQTRVDILLDNAGYELAADLALADYLLESGRAAQVRLHAKSYPVFVSDALNKDIHATLDFLYFEGNLSTHNMAVRLRSRLVDDRLRIEEHPFWTSPLAMWEMPGDLLAQFKGCTLLVVKGDANYRRLLGDRHWPHDLPFSAVVEYLPFGTLALRTLKSEIMLGVQPDRVPADDQRWMINGRWGLIQFAE